MAGSRALSRDTADMWLAARKHVVYLLGRHVIGHVASLSLSAAPQQINHMLNKTHRSCIDHHYIANLVYWNGLLFFYEMVVSHVVLYKLPGASYIIGSATSKQDV